MTNLIYNLAGAKTYNTAYLNKLRSHKKNVILSEKKNTDSLNINSSKLNISVIAKKKCKTKLAIIATHSSFLNLKVNLEKGSSLEINIFIFNPPHFANNTVVNLAEGSHLLLSNVILGNKQSEVVLNQTINHLQKNTRARITTRRVHLESSQSVVHGLLNIEAEAKFTDSYLSDRSLLLGSHAKAVAVPSLEIKTDAVKASHSATCTQLSPDQLFYLQSRGLPEIKAKELLIRSFCLDVLPKDSKFDKMVNQEITKLLNVGT